MLCMMKKFFRNLWCLRNLPTTLFFNFYYLPLKQAIHLPILLYKPKLLKCGGKVKIDTADVHFGMIILGKFNCSLYPNSGISIENNGGTLIFKGKALIGNNSFISISSRGVLVVGDSFECNASFKLACHNKITFENNVSFGWDCLVVDSDFHRLTMRNSEASQLMHSYGEVFIGHDSWIATNSIVLKNSSLPMFSVVGAGSLLNKSYSTPYTLWAGIPASAKKNGVYRDRDNDKIKF